MRLFLYTLLVSTLAISKTVRTDNPQPSDQTNLELSVSNDQSNSYQNQNSLKADVTNDGKHASLDASSQTVQNSQSKNELHLNIEQSDTDSDPNDSTISNSAMTNENINTLQQQSYNFKESNSLLLNMQNNNIDNDNNNSPDSGTDDLESNNPTGQNFGLISPQPDGASPQILGSGIQTNSPTQGQNIMSLSGTDPNSINNADAYGPTQPRDSSSPQGSPINYNDDNIPTAGGSSNGNTPPSSGGTTSPDSSQIGSGSLPISTSPGGQNGLNPSLFDPNSPNDAGTFGPSQFPDSSSLQGSPNNNNNDNIPPAGGSSNGNTPPSSGGPASPDSPQIGSGSLPISTSPGGQNGLNPSLFDPNSPNDAGTFGPSQFPDSSSLQGSPNNNNNDNIPPAGGSSNGNTPPSSGGPASPSYPQFGIGLVPLSYLPSGQNGVNPSLFDPNSINNAGAFGPSQPPDSSSPQGSPNNYNDDNIPTAGGSSNGNTPPSSGGPASPDSPQIGSGSIPISTSPGGQNGLNPSLFDPNSPNDAGTFGPSQFPDSSSLQGSPNNNNNDNIPPAGGISNGNTPPSSGGPASPDSPQIGSGSLPISTSPGGQNGLNPSLFDPNSPNDAGTFGPSQFPDSSSLQGSPNTNNNDNIPPAGGSSNGNTPPSSGGPASPSYPQFGIGLVPLSYLPSGQNGVNPSLFDPNSINNAGAFGPSQPPDSSSPQGSPNNYNDDNIPTAGGSSNGNTPLSSGGPASPDSPQIGSGSLPISTSPGGQNGLNPSLFDPNSPNDAGTFGPSQFPDSSSLQGSPNNNNNDNIPPAGGSSNGNTPPSSGGPASPSYPQFGIGLVPLSYLPSGQNGVNPSLFDPNSINNAGAFGPSQPPDSSSPQGSPINYNDDNIPTAGGSSNGNTPPSSVGPTSPDSPQIGSGSLPISTSPGGQNGLNPSLFDPNSPNDAGTFGPSQFPDSSSLQGSPNNNNNDNIPPVGGSSNGNTPPSSGGPASPDSPQIGSGSLPISTSPGGQNGLNPSLFDPNSPNDAGTFGPSQFPDSSSLQGSPNNNNNDNIPPAGGSSNGNTPPSSGGPSSLDSPQIGSGSLPISTSPGGQNGLNPSLFDPNSPNDAGTFGPSQFPDSSSLQGSPNNNNNDNIPPAGGSSNGNTPPSSGGPASPSYPQFGIGLVPLSYLPSGQNGVNPSLFDPNSINNAGAFGPSQPPDSSSPQGSPINFNDDNIPTAGGSSNGNTPPSSRGPTSPDSPQIGSGSLPISTSPGGQNGLNPSLFDPNSPNDAGTFGPSQFPDSSSLQGSPNNNNNDNIPPAGGSSNGNTPPSSGGPSSLDSPQIGSGSLPISTSPGGQNGLNPSLFDPNSPNDAGTFGPSQFPDSSSLQGSPNNNNNDNIPPAGGSSNGNTPPSSGGPASPSYPQFGIGLVPLSYLPSGQNGVNPSLFDPNSINNAGAFGPSQPPDSSSPQGSPINFNDDNIPTAGGSSNGNTPPSSGGPTSPDSPQIGSGSLPISTSPGGQNGLNPSLFDPNSPNDAGTFGPSQFPDSSSLQGSPNNNNNDNIPPAGGLSNGNSPPSSEGSSTVTNLYTKSSELSNSEYFNGGVSHSESSQFEESISITSDSTEMETQQYVLNSYSSGKFICDGYGKIIGVVFNHSADSGQGLDTIDLDTNSVIWEDINMLGLDIYQFSGNAGNYVGDKADNAYTSSKNSLGDAANYVGDKADNAYTSSKNSLGDAANHVGDIADNAYTSSKNSLGDAANYVGDKADNAYTASKNSLGDAANYVGDKADNAYTASKNSLGDAANYVGDKADNAYTSSKNSLGDAANYVGDKAGAVNDASKEAGNSIHSATNDYGHDLYDAGHNFKENAFGSSDGDVTNNV